MHRFRVTCAASRKKSKFFKIAFFTFLSGSRGYFWILKLFCSIKFFDKMHSFGATRCASGKKLNFFKISFFALLRVPSRYFFILKLFCSIKFFDKMHSFRATRSASPGGAILIRIFQLPPGKNFPEGIVFDSVCFFFYFSVFCFCPLCPNFFVEDINRSRRNFQTRSGHSHSRSSLSFMTVTQFPDVVKSG